jgi:cell division protein FtsZ
MEAPAATPPRMPRVEDFPPVVKAEIAARSQPQAQEDRGPIGLLKRLTNGLSRREEEETAPLQPARAPRQPVLREASPDARRLAAHDPQVYAPRRAHLDDHGRPTPAPTHDEDQLEIPAFLRRQAN